MKNKLLTVLNKFGYPVFLQGTINPEQAYPETFLTFWTDAVDDGGHFENETTSYDWNFTVIIYSNNPEIVNEKPNAIIAALKAAGFIPQGKGQDVVSDEPSHTGWAMDFIKTETIKEW